MIKKLLILVACTILLGGMLMTNPAPGDHEQAYYEANPFLLSAVEQGAEYLKCDNVSYHTIGVASCTMVEDTMFTIGLFGRVWVLMPSPPA